VSASISRRERIRRRAKKIKSLIEMLDNVRAGFYSDLDKIEDLFKELKLKDAPYRPSSVLKSAKAILQLPQKSPEYPRLKKLGRVATYLLFIGLAGLVIATFVLILNLSYYIYLAIITAVLVIVNISYFTKVYISQKIVKIYTEHESEFERHGEIIKTMIEYLLLKYRDEVRKLGLDPRHVNLKLRYSDYKGLSVKGKPGFFSAKYTLTYSR